MADQIPNSIPLTGKIAPTSTADKYPVTDPKYGLGGLRTVNSISGQSDNLWEIPYERRQEGMIAFVTSLSKYYHLYGGTANENWTELSISGGGAGFQGFQGPAGSGKYFYGSTEPSVGQGVTMGSKWFNTNLGLEFTYLKENDGDPQWIVVNVVGGGESGGGGDGYTFPNDLPVNIAVGKTFGRYVRGDVIPATGKTIPQILDLALNENLPPTVSLSTNPTSIAFNVTGPSITVNFGYVINSPNGATGASASLDFRVGAVGGWESLTSGILGLTSFSGSYNHQPTLSSMNTQDLQYKYLVEDSTGQTGIANATVSQVQHVNPSVSITITGTNLSSYETTYLRERGNTESLISAVITRNSPNVALVSWGYQYRTNVGGYANILTNQTISGNPSSFTTPTQTHTGPTSGINWIQYRFVVDDAYEQNTYESSQIVLNYLAFYGPTASPPTNGPEVRSVPTRNLISSLGNPFTFASGITENDFVVALPKNMEVSSVKDSQDVDLTVNFTNGYTSFDVGDYAGNTKSYNIYVNSQVLPYNPQVTFTVTTIGTVS